MSLAQVAPVRPRRSAAISLCVSPSCTYTTSTPASMQSASSQSQVSRWQLGNIFTDLRCALDTVHLIFLCDVRVDYNRSLLLLSTECPLVQVSSGGSKAPSGVMSFVISHKRMYFVIFGMAFQCCLTPPAVVTRSRLRAS